MIAPIIMGIAIVLHIIAALFAFRLIKTTGRRWAWFLIGTALALTAVQRMVPFYEMVFETAPNAVHLTNALVTLIIALLLVAGVALIAPLIQTYQRHEQLREVLTERTNLIQRLHEDVLRTLRQIHIALDVGKPVTLVLAQVNEISRSIESFWEEMKAGLLVGDSFGLALRSLVEEMTQNGPLPVQLDIDPEAARSVTKEQGTQLLHITREAVSNSQKHAKARRGRVALRAVPHAVALEIADNGRGFDVDLVEAQGHGLGNMVARARKIGAKLKIRSRPKQGTRIQVEVPTNGVPTAS